MASIKKKITKDGIIKFQITASLGRDSQNKQILKYATYTPNQKWSADKMEKEALKEATLFENKLKRGLIAQEDNIKFGDYALRWLENVDIAYKTRERYKDFLKRIIPAIGHIKLKDLSAYHLEQFYKELSQKGVKANDNYAIPTKLAEVINKKKISNEAISRKAGLSASTVGKAKKGGIIRIETAEKIAKVLGCKIDKIFKIHLSEASLSSKTVNDHHRLISNILNKAKREKLVIFNVASEHAQAPKRERTEAVYLSDVEARRVLECLEREEDIRVKTSIMILLFTGARRGELCGLSWEDIDFNDNVIHIRKASQYQKGNGIVTIQTKTQASVRSIKCDPFLFNQIKTYKSWWNSYKLKIGTYWNGFDNRLFIRTDGKPIHPDTINYWLKKFILKNNLPNFSPHSLRHTFATLQITSGIDIRTIQARTGHSQASTLLNVYSHAIQSANESASIKLGDVLLNRKDS